MIGCTLFLSTVHAGYQAGELGGMNYHMFVPDVEPKAEGFPLVMFLHGSGGRKVPFTTFALDPEDGNFWGFHTWHYPQEQTVEPAIVIAPHIPNTETIWAGSGWGGSGYYSIEKREESTRMKQAVAIVDHLIQNYPINPNRLYITGQSMGGGGTWDAIMRYPDKFAAAIPVCGYNDTTQAQLIKHIPLWVAHGLRDEAVLPTTSQAMVRELENLGVTVKTSWYEDKGHHIWIPMYRDEPDLESWLFSQSKGATTQAEFRAVRPVFSPVCSPASSAFSVLGRKMPLQAKNSSQVYILRVDGQMKRIVNVWGR